MMKKNDINSKLIEYKNYVDLFYEVSVGKYDNFRNYLKQNNIHTLNLDCLWAVGEIFLSKEDRFNQHTYRHGVPVYPIETLKEYACLFFDHLHFALQGTLITKVKARNLCLKYEAGALVSALNNTPVKKVNLSKNRLFDKHMAIIGPLLKNNTITHLNLNKNDIGPQGVKYLAEGLKQITSLKICDNRLGDEGAGELGIALKGTNVELVNIGRNEIEEDGAIDFAQTLKDTKVSILFIYGNSIRTYGASSFAQALVDSKVTMVDASGNDLESEGTVNFVEGLEGSGVKDLRLGYNICNLYKERIADALLDTVVTDIDIEWDDCEEEKEEEDSELSNSTDTQDEIEYALRQNKEKLVLPYYASALRLLPPQGKVTYLNLPALDEAPTQASKLKYAGGVLMAANLPSDILAHTLSFLPTMNKRKAEKFIKLSAENHPKGLRVSC